MIQDEASARLALPLLHAAQAQKEDDHNEALVRLDLAVQAVVQAAGVDAPPGAPEIDACWIVGEAPSGAWSGQAGALAGWTAGGWRFVTPFEGMRAWEAASGMTVRRVAGAWQRGTISASVVAIGGVPVVGPRRGAIATPSGGTTIDAEARATLAAILGALRGHGLIAT